MKLKILSRIASADNYEDILNEIKEYATDPDRDFANKAIKAMADLAVNVPEAIETASEHLLGFLNSGLASVLPTVMVTLGRILQKYPDLADSVLEGLKPYLANVDEAEGKAAVFWILGEYGDRIDDAPYILERFIDEFEQQNKRIVRLQLLTATVKLFFKRPPEVQKMLGRLLKAACEDTGAMDVRDRAMFYYRLLQEGPENARRVVCSAVYGTGLGRGKNTLPNLDEVLGEFNTLSVIFKKPAKQFSVEIEELDDVSESEEEEDEPAPQPTQPQIPSQPQSVAPQSQPVVPQPQAEVFDLLSFGAAPAPVQQPAALELSTQRPAMDQGKFQQGWLGWGDGARGQTSYSPDRMNQFPDAAKRKGLHVLAQGKQGNALKVYFFGSTAAGAYVFVEMVADSATRTLSWTAKSSEAATTQAASSLFSGLVSETVSQQM